MVPQQPGPYGVLRALATDHKVHTCQQLPCNHPADTRAPAAVPCPPLMIKITRERAEKFCFLWSRSLPDSAPLMTFFVSACVEPAPLLSERVKDLSDRVSRGGRGTRTGQKEPSEVLN